MALPLVSALVLNYRSPQETVCCVQALLKQTVKQLEIVVIDNHSEDDSIGVLRNRLGDMPNVRIVETPRNLGFAAGNNYGKRFIAGEYVFIINPDNELEREGLERMIAFLRAHPDVGILGPKLTHADGTQRTSFRSFPRPIDVIAKRTVLGRLFPEILDRYLMRHAHPEDVQDVDWLVGTCMLLKCDVFEELAGFDPCYFLFFDDVDLCRRCWKAGRRVVYFPKAEARDRKRRLSEGGVWSLLMTRVGRAHIASACKYFRKWGHS